MELEFRSVAQRELAEAIIYYRDIDHTLGVRFLREFETTIERLLTFPTSGHPRRGGAYRLALMRGFPYGIAYSCHEEVLVVEAVPHLRRKPDYWRNLNG